MRRAIDFLIWALLLGGAAYFGYLHQTEVMVAARQIEAKFLPCRSPITYSLGAIDPQFGMGTSTLIARLKEAETIWEQPSGRDLFAYAASGGAVTVNLVYDYRQQATDKMKASGIQITRSLSSYESLKAQYERMERSISAEKAALQKNIATYEAREAAYNAEVEKWNRKGGAPPATYDRLQEEKAALQGQVQAIKAAQAKVNADIDTLNALGASLNKLIAELNLNVEKYNQAGASAGKEFEEGTYESRAGEQRIDIYEYSSRTELVRVLAHEFGHAFGIGHVADPEAIMYEINRSDTLVLSADDTAALDAACSAGIGQWL
ncbi:hypothetical protein A2763_03185 [Candidatus Kaiserbacteria bacterium RIFCSPHIGHO2_01_FULL_54_36]|uniref:Peptidase M10 metallopeptidase domain-containing protein n=1 Tax=Candidatus Kaiserbacteria bacterium RIFCSPHIGHO2_01_FULL_54_36 TaxID=1798482 RepID=A0A1F6CKA7_9BACT|nr:MAG: hypothetical protein A2763_03185 [Candidatus Kaiserbacteria bacterium RIFCSPHIGHO2_01_FULL_54_36]OGG75403.1 MAG: hypothetical protein A3A41_02440 [Candidatus Kaiserbacteria bacterium RIFCSPLOWO2_01_FULL_54_22]